MNSKKDTSSEIPEGYELIFRRWRLDKQSGKWLDARQYGHKAWPMLVKSSK